MYKYKYAKMHAVFSSDIIILIKCVVVCMGTTKLYSPFNDMLQGSHVLIPYTYMYMYMYIQYMYILHFIN